MDGGREQLGMGRVVARQSRGPLVSSGLLHGVLWGISRAGGTTLWGSESAVRRKHQRGRWAGQTSTLQRHEQGARQTARLIPSSMPCTGA